MRDKPWRRTVIQLIWIYKVQVIYIYNIFGRAMLQHMEKESKRVVKKDFEMAERLVLLRKAFAGDNQRAFAENIVKTVTYRQWNNYENGYQVPREVIRRLCQLFAGLSSDWILFGDVDKLSPAMAIKLGLWPSLPTDTN